MKRFILIIPIIVFIIIIAVLSVMTLQTKEGRNPSIVPSALLGKEAPNIELPMLARNIPGGFKGSDLVGRVNIVNVFSSWCVPCLVEHPQISWLATNGFPIYAINHRDNVSDASNWLKKHGNPYVAVGFDPEGTASLEWGVGGVPETFIINASGIITYKHIGPITKEILKEKILPKLHEAKR